MPAMWTNYAFFFLGESRVRCPTQDMTVDRPSGQIWLFIRKAKDDKRRDTPDKPIVTITVVAKPAIVDLLEWYCTQRIAY
jgi:hypothetical protein